MGLLGSAKECEGWAHDFPISAYDFITDLWPYILYGLGSTFPFLTAYEITDMLCLLLQCLTQNLQYKMCLNLPLTLCESNTIYIAGGMYQVENSMIIFSWNWIVLLSAD